MGVNRDTSFQTSESYPADCVQELDRKRYAGQNRDKPDGQPGTNIRGRVNVTVPAPEECFF
jgi:hypothetical protein